MNMLRYISIHPGGMSSLAITIYDFIKFVRPTIKVIGTGYVASDIRGCQKTESVLFAANAFHDSSTQRRGGR
jgi:hypothetical protein